MRFPWGCYTTFMKILAFETSCDETALALLEATGGLKSPKFKVVENLVSTQINIHRPFGGVVPNLAKREHLKNLPVLLKRILNSSAKGGSASGGKSYLPRRQAGILNSIDLVAVTVGPGLEPALWTGVVFAKELAKKYKKPLIGGNHLEGHLYSFLLSHKKPVKFPAIGLIVSGGHTILLNMESLTSWKKIGETRDDAVGEAFDKVARILGLPYPGGPEVEKLAKSGKVTIDFPRPMLTHKNYDFSFSGLKTSVLYFLRDNPLPTGRQAKAKKADIAASFQQAAIDVLVKKTINAAQSFGAKTIILGGGVAANKALRDTLKKEAKRVRKEFLVPKSEFNTDNAAMIAAASYINFLKKKKYKITAQANLNM